MHDAPARADHELRILGAMVDCAYELGAAFGEAAKAQADHGRRLELFDAFNRGFLAVRMGIRLSMTLRAPVKPARMEVAEQDPTEKVETYRPERDPVERERERDREPVSLPKFLATLRGVAADAARLEPTLPADLSAGASTLRDLLYRANTDAVASAAAPPAGGVDLLTRPPSKSPPRASLLGSASATLAAPLARRGAGPPPLRRSG